MKVSDVRASYHHAWFLAHLIKLVGIGNERDGLEAFTSIPEAERNALEYHYVQLGRTLGLSR